MFYDIFETYQLRKNLKENEQYLFVLDNYLRLVVRESTQNDGNTCTLYLFYLVLTNIYYLQIQRTSYLLTPVLEILSLGGWSSRVKPHDMGKRFMLMRSL